MKRFLALLLTVVLAIGMLPLHDAQADYLTAVVKGGWLRLREYASFDAPTITSYYTGTQVLIQGTSGAWYHVIGPDGRTGYMLGAYLTIGATGAQENIPAWVTSANGQGVRLRSGPSTAYGVIGLYSVGTRATILKSGANWHYVKIGNQKGYMMARYLTTHQPSEPSITDSYTAYVTSSNGQGVNLRHGAGLGYGVIGLYKVGTKVTVLNPGSTWHYIDIRGTRGYMMAKYLTTHPVDANDSYTAYVTSSNGLPVRMRAGAGTGYAVLGRYSVGTEVLVLKHNATWDYIRIGSTEGYMMNKYLVQGISSTQVTGAVIKPSDPAPGDVLKVRLTPENAKVSYQWMNEDGDVLSTSAQYTVKKSDLGERIRVRVKGKSGYTGTATSAYVTVMEEAPEEDNDEPVKLSGTVKLPSSILPGVTLQPTISVNCHEINFQWMVGGTVVSSESSLLVTKEMAGRKIVLVISAPAGSGYTGALESNTCTVLSTSAPSTYTDL